jgi:uncharacterized membrane protein YoaK (UPF0700 family)
MAKNVDAKRRDLEELEEIRHLNEQSRRQEAAVQAKETERRLRKEQKAHERRVNAVLRIVTVVVMYLAAVWGLLWLADLGAVEMWFSLVVAMCLTMCASFHTGYYWREYKI